MTYGVKSKTHSRYLEEFDSYGEARVFTLKLREVWNNATMQIYEIDGLQEDILVEQFSPTKGVNYNKITTMKKLTKKEQKDEAWEVHLAITAQARETFHAAAGLAWETCLATTDLVWETCEAKKASAINNFIAKCKEIDERESK